MNKKAFFFLPLFLSISTTNASSSRFLVMGELSLFGQAVALPSRAIYKKDNNPIIKYVKDSKMNLSYISVGIACVSLIFLFILRKIYNFIFEKRVQKKVEERYGKEEGGIFYTFKKIKDFWKRSSKEVGRSGREVPVLAKQKSKKYLKYFLGVLLAYFTVVSATYITIYFSKSK